MDEGVINLYADGASRGNPGSGGAGAVLMDENGQIIASVKKALGICTNNTAEYMALIIGLKEAKKRKYRRLKVFLDSELIVRQINGSYQVKNENLKVLMKEVRKLLSFFDFYSVEHIQRDLNRIADKLANEAIEESL